MTVDRHTRAHTGIGGLDVVLDGGLIPGRSYLVRGGPGTGKTTLGLHFLAAGGAAGEPSLFITLGEREDQIRQDGELLGFDLDGVSFLDLTPGSEFFAESEAYDIFSPAEVERRPLTEAIVRTVEELEPRRVFLDSMTQFRHLTPDAFQFRKQVLSFIRFLLERDVTLLFTSEEADASRDQDLQFMADGVLELGTSDRGRVVSVQKLRGSGFLPGRHSLRISGAGLTVFPRLLPEEFEREIPPDPVSTGIPALDELLHGGLERGTVTIISGPSGVGKTSVGLQVMKEAAGRGEPSVVYLFEESRDVLLARCDAINIPARAMIDRGMLKVVSVEPLRYSPDEFAALVREEVEERGATIVMLDSISGYRLALKGEELVTHLHGLCRYLVNMGVTGLVTNEVERITGDFQVTEAGISFIADNIVFLRYYELEGELRKAIGVLKKRLSGFELSLRELAITCHGLKVGAPLRGMRGILSGAPEVRPPAAGGGAA